MCTYLIQLTSYRTTDYSPWKVTKNLKRPVTQISPIKEENGRWTVSNEQKAMRFAGHLEQIFHPNIAITESKHVKTEINITKNIYDLFHNKKSAIYIFNFFTAESLLIIT